MEHSSSFVNELGGNTPDSGIDMSKFNIVDYILNNSEPGDIVWEPPNLASDPTATLQLLPNTNPSVDASNSPLPGLRTNCKLEFQRRKALEESQREKRALSSLHPPPQSTPVNLPQGNSAGGPAPVANIPKELLFVETRLENPTKYHLQQCVRNNITRYNLEAGSEPGMGLGMNARGGSVPPPEPHVFGLRGIGLGGAAGPGSAPPNIFMPARLLSTSQSAVLNPSSINSSLGTSAGSDPMATPESLSTLSEMKELMMDEGMGTGAGTGSGSGRNSAGGISRNDSGGSRNGGQGSEPNSPLLSPDTPEEHVKAAKDRQKKDNHNKIERRRRYLINDMITLQGQQLPKVNEPYYEKFGDVKQNKGAILQASVDYIQILKDENEAWRRKEEVAAGRAAAAEADKKKLLLRIQELEQICSCNGISIPEENLTWRRQQLEAITALMSEPLSIKQEPKLCEFMDDNRMCMVSGGVDPMLGPMEDLTSLEDVVMEIS